MTSAATCKFDHLQLFVDALKPLDHYKAIESRLNTFAVDAPSPAAGRWDVAAARKAWCDLGPAADPDAFHVHAQDIVEQLLYAFGWRVTGSHEGPETRSLLLSTIDPNGVRFVVTCKQQHAAGGEDSAIAAKRHKPASTPDHFAAAHLDRFRAYHNGARGFGVLGFEVTPGELDVILRRYQRLHPKLLVDGGVVHTYGAERATPTRVLDVWAYYAGAKGEADVGTSIRFVERTSNEAVTIPLPGLTAQPATFPSDVLPAYCDHWVSNVRSREGFLRVLEETLGFTPKVRLQGLWRGARSTRWLDSSRPAERPLNRPRLRPLLTHTGRSPGVPHRLLSSFRALLVPPPRPLIPPTSTSRPLVPPSPSRMACTPTPPRRWTSTQVWSQRARRRSNRRSWATRPTLRRPIRWRRSRTEVKYTCPPTTPSLLLVTCTGTSSSSARAFSM